MTTPKPEAATPEEKRPERPLWFDQRRSEFRFSLENGPVILSSPRVLRPEEIDDLEQYLALVLRRMRRTANSILEQEQSK